MFWWNKLKIEGWLYQFEISSYSNTEVGVDKIQKSIRNGWEIVSKKSHYPGLYHIVPGTAASFATCSYSILYLYSMWLWIIMLFNKIAPGRYWLWGGGPWGDLAFPTIKFVPQNSHCAYYDYRLYYNTMGTRHIFIIFHKIYEWKILYFQAS